MDGKLLVAIIGLIIGISGWATLIYNHITHKPKIKGRIFEPIVGQMKFTQDGKKRHMTTYLTYLYLTTSRKTSIRILDYEMLITYTDGTSHKLERFYGTDIEKFKFTWVNNEILNLNLNENLIYKKQAAVDQKEPLHGFVLFGGEEVLYNRQDEVSKIEVTLTDVFGNTHQVSENNLDKKLNLYLLSDLAGFDIPLHIEKTH
ncbi:hypothetical protein [Peribacillus frigoritolerans]|uniref:hypothetical protein n=1 Tax=Peribacillus frigoritolerans TaxID=450367 RepID=UPI00364402D9